MAKEIFRRYIWLVDTIRRGKGLTFEEINNAWQRSCLNEYGTELSKRTFRNWLNALPTALGIWVECARKAPFKYYIMEDESNHNDLIKWTMNAYSIGNIMSENRLLHERILLEDIPTANETLEIICNAMRHNHQIYMKYKPFGGNSDYDFETKPYALKLNERRWYLIAHSDKHNKEFTYGLDRIIEVRELDKTFEIPPTFSAKRKFKSCIGMHSNEDSPVELIRLKVTGYVRDYIETLPIHDSQEIEERTTDYTIFRFHLIENYELIDTITGLGAHCEVIEPLSLRKAVREKAEEIAKINK